MREGQVRFIAVKHPSFLEEGYTATICLYAIAASRIGFEKAPIRSNVARGP